MMTQQESVFAMVMLSDLGGLLEALRILHGLQFPEVTERYSGLLSSLIGDPSRMEWTEIRVFCAWATATIDPALRELPEYRQALAGWLSGWEGGTPC